MLNQKLGKAFEFKGKLTKKSYFEGWYFKMVSKDLNKTLSLIPGVSLNKTDPHAFIQVIYYNKTNKLNNIYTDYIRYDIDAFSYWKELMEVRIGDSIFSPTYVHLDIRSKDTVLTGEISYNEHQLIKTNLLSPSVMGIFSYVPRMECYHSIVSMNHHTDGVIQLNEETLDFHEAKGYIEKDYGTSFPINYIWAQSNSFKDTNTSIIFSIATVPFLGMKFKGLITVLRYKHKEYRFATYNFAKVKHMLIKENLVELALKRGKYKLKLEISIDETKDLSSPKAGVMSQTIKEGLSGKIMLSLYKRDHLIYEDIGNPAGVEIMME